jgi:hypothetical protein
MRALKPSIYLVCVVLVWMAGCAPMRPYRVGGPELEKLGFAAPHPQAAKAPLPAGRPLVVSLFSWRVANPVGLVLNYDGRRSSDSEVQATYYSRGVHVALFEAFFDDLGRRRANVFRDYVGKSEPGLVPAWARQQQFVVLTGEILRFEHTKAAPPDRAGPTPDNPSPQWGHEMAYVQIHIRIRDTVTARLLFDKVVNTWTKAQHTHLALGFDAYRALASHLVDLLRQDPAFGAALAGGAR